MDRYNRHSFGQPGTEPSTFATVVPVGSKAPDFTLPDLEGKTFSLSRFSGQKHIILEFGNITWPPFIGEVLPLQRLQQKFEPSGFEVLFVYTRESHPGENFPHHDSYERKLEHARKLRELEGVTVPILMDDFRGTVHRAYGLLSNMVYLIHRDGTVVYKSDWTDDHELEGMCEELLRLDEMKAQGVPIIRQGRSERLHWMPMDPALRERVYRRSGEKAIRDYLQVMGHLPYATDAEKARHQGAP